MGITKSKFDLQKNPIYNSSIQELKPSNLVFLKIYPMDTKTLSAAQIRYLRIGPRANKSKVLKQQLIQVLQEEKKQQGAEFQNGMGHLNRIPKYGYGELSITVNNFGVLINHNFGTSSTLHQIQKFGKLAKQVDNIMQAQKDQPLEDAKKSSASRINQKQDKRTFIKSIYNYQGEKVFVVLHSFSLQAVEEHYKEDFPFSIMKLIVSRLGSAKLSSVIESALRFEQNVEVNYQKIKEKLANGANSEQKYQNLAYKFEKIGTQFKINLPHLEFSHIESNFKSIVIPSNKDILDILTQEFDNLHDIVYKYFDHEGFSRALDSQAHDMSRHEPEQAHANDQTANAQIQMNEQDEEIMPHDEQNQEPNEEPEEQNDSDAE